MKRITRIITVSAVILGITFIGSNVAARNVSSDQAALTPARTAAAQGVEKKVDALLARMTVDEKLQQVQLLSDGQITDADAEGGSRWRLLADRPREDQPLPAGRR